MEDLAANISKSGFKAEMLPSGKRLHNYGKSPFFMGKSSTISMAMFNSYVCLPDGTEHP
jgi:hypothetical protein